MTSQARNTGKKWTDDADAALLRMWRAGERTDRISAQLGRSALSLASRLALLGEFPETELALAAVQKRAAD